MNDLDRIYASLLQVGFIVMAQSATSGSLEWLEAEIDMLHNIPSLISDDNRLRHEYYWQKERTAYIEWMNANGSEMAISRMRTYYEPLWDEMQKLMFH